MKYMLMDYVNEAGWPELSADDKERWLGVYRAYVEAMAKAGVLKGSGGLMPTSAATTVRVVDGKTQVLDGPTPTPRNRSPATTSSRWPTSTPPSPGPPVARRRSTAWSRSVHSGNLGRPRLPGIHRQPSETSGQ
jgi:hypothetical protein